MPGLQRQKILILDTRKIKIILVAGTLFVFLQQEEE